MHRGWLAGFYALRETVVLFNAARLSDSQRHLRELGRLDRSYHETLERDRQEREVQVQVQKENSSLAVESLRRRYVRYVYVARTTGSVCLLCVHRKTARFFFSVSYLYVYLVRFRKSTLVDARLVQNRNGHIHTECQCTSVSFFSFPRVGRERKRAPARHAKREARSAARSRQPGSRPRPRASVRAGGISKQR